ncbi:MAG: polysaccharide biosynthesis tyrosine autokinase [Pirellulaceae bacterium]|nr:polysaccharide biosynthesis tyrosine autokinase [Pirellulaceae bacterium]
MSNNANGSRQVEFSGPPESQDSGWAFLGFVWRRLWLIILAVIVGLGLGYLNFHKQPAVFQSSAEILIAKQRMTVPIPGVQPESQYDSTHETLLRSPVIINEAVEDKKHDLGALASLRGSGNPVGQIIAGLTVQGTVGESGDLIRFSYSSVNPEDCPKVLNAVIDAYQRFLDDTYQDVNQETADLITTAKELLDDQISDKQQDYQKFRDAAPLLFLGGEGKNVHESRLQQIETMRSELQVTNWQAQAKIDAVEAALKRGGSREALNLMIGQLRDSGDAAGASGPGSKGSVEEQLFPLLMEEQMLLEDFGPDHPKVATVRKRIELTRKHLLGSLPASGDGAGQATEPRDFYQVYLESLREQIRMNEEQLASMTRLFDQETTAAKAMDKYQIQDANYRAEIQRKERMFDAVVARLEEINVSKDLGNIKTRVINPPGTGYQIAPDMKKSLTTAGILGLLAGLGLAFLVDSLDRRFRSPDDIRNELGLPVVGHIPTIPVSAEQRKSRQMQEDEGDNAISPALRVYHHPRGRIAEAYRAVRTALYFSTRGTAHKVIQVTSPNPGDGKTTLASNLAVSIANSGKRTLLIDADFRRPRVHKVFGLGDGVGLSEVMSGSVELADAILETAIDGLSILICGRRPANPAELLTSTKFQQLIEVLREKYDMVIVDTPPVLAVTDPLAVAPRVDGVLLVIRLGKSARSVAQNALEALDSIGGTVLGVVVNGVGGGSRYGGYGAYGYGYRYGGYGSSYRYGDGQYGDGYGYGYGYGYGEHDGDGDGEKGYVTKDDGRTRQEAQNEEQGARGKEQREGVGESRSR